jgi:hypothetical protein
VIGGPRPYGVPAEERGKQGYAGGESHRFAKQALGEEQGSHSPSFLHNEDEVR